MKGGTASALALGSAALGAVLMWAVMPDKDDAEKDEKKPATEAAEPAGGPTLDAEAQRAAGIVIAPVAAASTGGGRTAYARAIDLSPLAALAADAETARAAVAASARQLARLTALAGADQSAAQRDVEAARAQLAADRARLTLACRKIGLDFGAGLERIGCSGISALVQQAAAGQAALLRIDATDGTLPAGGTLRIGDGGATAQILGPAVTADAQLQSPGVLALVRGPQAAQLGVGRVLSVQLGGGGGQSGVLVPRSALMRADGGMFVYRPGKEGRFTRVALSGAVPLDGGWFVPAGPLKPGDAIVVSGATTLLGLERAPAPAEAD